MKVTLESKPFNEFWMNGMLNQVFSIASSAHPSYRYAAYLNIYRYFQCEAATDRSFRYPTIDSLYYIDNWSEFPLTRIIKHVEPGHFRSKETFIEEIKEVLRSGRNLCVNVDLHDWLPGSLAWQKFHWHHYSLFNGFDDERSLFFVIDDSRDGYNEHEIPEERLQKAILNLEYCFNREDGGPDYYVYNLHSDIEPFELQLTEVAQNAERLTKELAEFSMEGMWNVERCPEKFQSHMTYAIIGINNIATRHTANEGLIRTIREQKLLSARLCDFLMVQLRAIQEGWNGIKNAFVNYTFDRERELELAQAMLDRERALWSIVANR